MFSVSKCFLTSTHIHTQRATWHSASGPRTLWHADGSPQESNHQLSDELVDEALHHEPEPKRRVYEKLAVSLIC